MSTYLKGRPAFTAVTALLTLEAFWIVTLMRIHMKSEVLLGQKAWPTDPAVMRSQQRLEGFVVLASQTKMMSTQLKVYPLPICTGKNHLMINERYIRKNVLSVHIFFIFFAKKTPWWAPTLLWEELLVIRAVVWWGVFVLWIWLTDTLLHSTAIRNWGSSVLQPRRTSLFRSLGVHYSLSLRLRHCRFCKTETFILLWRRIHKRCVSKEQKFKLGQCSSSSAAWDKRCFAPGVNELGYQIFPWCLMAIIRKTPGIINWHVRGLLPYNEQPA